LVTAGSLPGGLSLSPAGQITGTPTGPAGTSTFTVQVRDAETPAQSGTAQLSINIARETTTLSAKPGVARVGLLSTRVDVSAVLTGGPSHNPIAGQTINFSVNQGEDKLCTAVTDGSGVAACSGSVPALLGLGTPDSYQATFAGSPSLTPSSATASIS
jgi:hypothetical protein